MEGQCYFFDLLPELRERIYKDALIHHGVLEIYPSGDPVEYLDEWQKDERSWANFRPSEPSLLKTCRLIRDEGLPVFYGGNVFKDTPYDPCGFRFVEWLTAEKRLMLKCLRIQHRAHDIFQGDGCYYVACVVKARRRQEEMKEWVEQSGFEVPDGSIYVFVKLHDNSAGVWTNNPTGECKLGGCCGIRQNTMLVGS